MRNFVPRLLTILSAFVLVSFVASAFAWGGLIGSVIDTVEDVIQEDVSTDDAESIAVDESDEVIDLDDGLLELDGEDKYVTIENELLEDAADALGVDEVGSTLYSVQEDTVHGSVTSLTGKKIDHYYAWICIGKVCLPVDPFTASN